jgi:Tol biopolymer transport system component
MSIRRAAAQLLTLWVICVLLIGTALLIGRALHAPMLAYAASYEIWLLDGLFNVTQPITFDGSQSMDDTPDFSPDGQQLTFMVVRSPPNNVRLPDGELAVINVDGSGFRYLLRQPGWDAAPVWSPDGTAIAYRTNQNTESGTALEVLTLADGTVRRLHESYTRSDMLPAWTGDSRALVFHADYDGRVLPLIVQRDGALQSAVPLIGRTMVFPRPSPDGRLLAGWIPAFDGYALAIYTLDLGEMRPLTPAQSNPSPFGWSPDGHALAYTTLERMSPVIRRIDAITGELTTLARPDGRVTALDWRP